MSDPVILSYFDSLLRQSDIALLEKPNWLNDKIIGFAFQYYQEVKYQIYRTNYGTVPEIQSRMIGLGDKSCLGCFQKTRCMFC